MNTHMAVVHYRMGRQKFDQMFGYANWPNTRTTAPMRNGISLVQVQVANIGTDTARIGQPHLCIHIGTIHVDLSAITVDNVAHFDNRRLEHPVR